MFSHPRRGTTIIEFVVACSLLGSLMLFVVPSAIRIERLQRVIRQDRIAMDEITNQLERLAQLPLGQLKEEVDSLTPSEFAATGLSNPRLSGTLLDSQDGYRLAVEISWDSPGRREAPVSMATWLYPGAATDSLREQTRAMNKLGHSLTELLVVMSMTSVVFTVGVGLVHRLMHEQKFADRDNAMHRVAERLSTRLREDVHLAISAKLFPPGDESEQRLELNQPGQRTVAYTIVENILEREATGISGPRHRDGFQFPDNYLLQFHNVSAERVTFTAYALPQAHMMSASEESRRAELESETRRAVMHLEARVGQDHRFSGKKRKPSE